VPSISDREAFCEPGDERAELSSRLGVMAEETFKIRGGYALTDELTCLPRQLLASGQQRSPHHGGVSEEDWHRALVAGAAPEGPLRQGIEAAALPLPKCLQITGDG